MDRISLIDLLDKVFVKEGFKKKGSSWLDNNGQIIKVVKLEKSSFGNRFYITYGYILKGLPLAGLRMHLYHRLSSEDPKNRLVIENLLDLENSKGDSERKSVLGAIIVNELVPKMLSVKTEDDILLELKARCHLNSVPQVVQDHFGLQ